MAVTTGSIDVRRVEPAAQADFDDAELDAGAAESSNAIAVVDFEERRLASRRAVARSARRWHPARPTADRRIACRGRPAVRRSTNRSDRSTRCGDV